jgi:hypothetical protein
MVSDDAGIGYRVSGIARGSMKWSVCCWSLLMGYGIFVNMYERRFRKKLVD